MAQDHFKCTRCGRIRSAKYITKHKVRGVWKDRCIAKSTCASIAKRNRKKKLDTASQPVV